MERLTKRIPNAEGKNIVVFTKGEYEDTTAGEMTGSDIRIVLRTLADYEDLEDQGLLLKLPCKVGDTVYEICDGFIEPCTVEVIFLADYTDKDGKHSYMAEIHYDREDCPYVSTEIYFTDFGKTVFLTQAEAEDALKRTEERN